MLIFEFFLIIISLLRQGQSSTQFQEPFLLNNFYEKYVDMVNNKITPGL